MIISEEYKRLMFYNELPERFLAVIRDADSDVVQNIIAEVFMKSAEIRNRLSK